MSQHDYEITKTDANTGGAFRAATNAALQALASNNSGEFEPETPYGGMWWISIADGIVKQRNVANDAWIDKFQVDDELAPYSSIAFLEAAFNFLGLWVDQAGALAVPASVYHDDKQWQLLEDLADVTASEPGVDPEWLDMSFGAQIHAATAKTPPVDLDELGLADSADTFSLKKLTFANLKATILSTWKDTTGNLVGLTLFKINFKNVADTFTSFFTNTNTAARTYAFQDRDGTIADDTDISNLEAAINANLGAVENDCINGTFDRWERYLGSPVTIPAAIDTFVADRAGSYRTAGSSLIVDQKTFTPGQTLVPENPEFYHEGVFATDSSVTEENYHFIRIKDVEKYSGETIAVQLYGSADSSKDVAVEITQNFGSGGSSSVQVGVETVSMTTSLAKKIFFISIPSVSGKTVGTLSYTEFKIWMSAGSDFDSNTNSLGNQSGTLNIAEIKIYSSDEELFVRRRSKEETREACNPFGHWGTASAGGSIYSSGDILRCELTYRCKLIKIPSCTAVDSINASNVAAPLVTDLSYLRDDISIIGRGVTATNVNVWFSSRYFLHSEL